jgi:hypothetical protein
MEDNINEHEIEIAKEFFYNKKRTVLVVVDVVEDDYNGIYPKVYKEWGYLSPRTIRVLDNLRNKGKNSAHSAMDSNGDSDSSETIDLDQFIIEDLAEQNIILTPWEIEDESIYNIFRIHEYEVADNGEVESHESFMEIESEDYIKLLAYSMRYGDINIQWLRRIDNELYIRLIESFEERYKKYSEGLFETFFSNTLEFNGCKPYVFTLDELKDDVQKIKSIYQE